jgi:hypothetical protein
LRCLKSRVAILLPLIALAACGPVGGQPISPTSTPVPVAVSPTAMPEPPAPTPPGSSISGEATVESVELLMLESFPVQVRAVVKGYTPDSCTTISDIKQERESNTFNVTIITTRPADLMCAEVITPFEETIPLDVVGLKAGTYTVNVNGVSATFTLSADNAQP